MSDGVEESPPLSASPIARMSSMAMGSGKRSPAAARAGGRSVGLPRPLEVRARAWGEERCGWVTVRRAMEGLWGWRLCGLEPLWCMVARVGAPLVHTLSEEVGSSKSSDPPEPPDPPDPPPPRRWVGRGEASGAPHARCGGHGVGGVERGGERGWEEGVGGGGRW